jgi:hypothetical protein
VQIDEVMGCSTTTVRRVRGLIRPRGRADCRDELFPLRVRFDRDHYPTVLSTFGEKVRGQVEALKRSPRVAVSLLDRFPASSPRSSTPRRSTTA